MFQDHADQHVNNAPHNARQAALDDEHQLAVIRRDKKRTPAVEDDRHRCRGGKALEERHQTHDLRPVEELDRHRDRADGQRKRRCQRDTGIGVEHAVQDEVQHQNAEVDEQRHQRLFHRIVGLVQKVEHGESAHAERVAGEDAARHLGRLSGEAAAFKDNANDIRAERAHHRADRQDEKQRIFRHVPDVAKIALRVLLRELAVKAREHDRADAVEHARRERGEELIGIVERTDGAVVERRGGRRVDEIAEQKDRKVIKGIILAAIERWSHLTPYRTQK